VTFDWWPGAINTTEVCGIYWCYDYVASYLLAHSRSYEDIITYTDDGTALSKNRCIEVRLRNLSNWLWLGFFIWVNIIWERIGGLGWDDGSVVGVGGKFLLLFRLLLEEMCESCLLIAAPFLPWPSFSLPVISTNSRRRQSFADAMVWKWMQTAGGIDKGIREEEGCGEPCLGEERERGEGSIWSLKFCFCFWLIKLCPIRVFKRNFLSWNVLR
jgi:hypothetical protein